MPDVQSPHYYVPAGPVEAAPVLGFEMPEVREVALDAVLKGVPLGAYDHRMLDWLATLDDTTCRTVASIMWRCRIAGVPDA